MYTSLTIFIIISFILTLSVYVLDKIDKKMQKEINDFIDIIKIKSINAVNIDEISKLNFELNDLLEKYDKKLGVSSKTIIFYLQGLLEGKRQILTLIKTPIKLIQD